MSPSLLEQAQDGDAAAIAALLTSALKPKGITVRGDRQSYCLQLWFTGDPAPPQAATVAYARRALEKLQVSAIGILQVYGEQTQGAQPVWTEEVALLSAPLDDSGDVLAESDFSQPPCDAESQPPVFEPLVLGNVPPDDVPPAAIARAYQELGLEVGASLSQVEAAYFKRRAALLRQGGRAALEPLKWAFTTLKTHLEQQASVEAAPGLAAQEPAAVSRVGLAQRSIAAGQPRPAQPYIPDDTDILDFDNRYSNGLIFPVLLLLGMLMNAIPIVNILLWGIKIWIHEFGHATVAWLAGRRAIPLPIGWTSVDPRRSLFVYCGILLLLVLLYQAGRREEKRWPVVLAVVLAIVQFFMTWLISADAFDMLLSFGGVGGEIYLSALLIVGFYFPLPQYFRWDFYRFPVVLGAAFCFWGQVWLWQQVPRGKASIPFGSLWGEADHGDMNQLINVHGWTPGDIIGTYSAIAHLCLLAIVAVYGYTLFRQHRDVFVALRRQWLP
ncbi:hypothetical protein IQ265_05050 [Nodosilinea sp. LEGE 06152]|uniref:hypothetical protein n=1 Tax=Nodosilinea sp. LEGE 06152 TaxID=2777966 RepID=UPI00187FBF75|nr:hypothetical protein [Nodosilinea sp. LEGE 06152]MBE9156197.1 hypothetical protein [Nodosilinea sp. LEGE 06152]